MGLDRHLPAERLDAMATAKLVVDTGDDSDNRRLIIEFDLLPSFLDAQGAILRVLDALNKGIPVLNKMGDVANVGYMHKAEKFLAVVKSRH